MRERIGKIGTEAAEAVGYRSAGTIEGLLQDGEYFFLEMNTRVQVEHCVTEEVTGVDIVKEQIKIAAGEPLSFKQDDIGIHGHAIECRINAEDASKNFAPAPGKITTYREAAGPGVRTDSGVEAGSEITPMYDPMVAKLIVWDKDRESATRRMIRALKEMEVGGVKTLIPFHIGILDTEEWANGETCRNLIEDKEWLKQFAFEKLDPAGGRGRGDGRAHLRGRGLGPQVRRQGDRRRVRRRRRRQRRRPRQEGPEARQRSGGGGGGSATSSRRSRARCSRSRSRRAPRSKRARSSA